MKHTCHPIDTKLAADWDLVGSPWLIGCGVFVQKQRNQWLRFSLAFDSQPNTLRWHVTCYKTKRQAVQDNYGSSRPGFAFQWAGPNLWETTSRRV